MPNDRQIEMADGGGGAASQRLLEQIILPAFDCPALNTRHDGAVIQAGDVRLAFTTDSYVIHPYFFPGGDIGSLAVHGTVNDLAMCGARPLYLSVGLILEEGLPIGDLQRIVSSMALAARQSGVALVTGDTKVVDRGSGDGVFINTAGIGQVDGDIDIAPSNVQAGDAVILSGDIGRHGIAVMAAREGLQFETDIESDSAALVEPVQALLGGGVDVHCLRDATRGGIVSALVEIARVASVRVDIDETVVPVTDPVRGACEILGFDPLYVANEGRFIAFVPAAQQERALQLLHPCCPDACVIGTASQNASGVLVSKTAIGGQRVLDMLNAEQLPRIC